MLQLGHMRAFLLAVAASLTMAINPAAAQPALFSTAPAYDIGPQQQQALSNISSRPTTSSVQLVKVNANALLGESVTMALPGVGVERADRSKTEARVAGDYTWIGDIAKDNGRAILVVKNGDITGSIESPTYRYSIVPLGGGVHALIKIDQSRFPPDHPPGGARGGALQGAPTRSGEVSPAVLPPKDQIDKAVAQKRAAATNGAAGDVAVADPIVVDILVAWTVEARTAYGGDMAAFAQLAVNAANAAYTASNANVSLRLVGTREVTYSETGRTFDDMLNAVTSGADPAMAPVHTQRASTGADLVSLMINNTSFCGLAWLNSDSSSAFSTVYWSCAVSNHSFAHEIGHNFGARHDPFVDPTNTPLAYAHGYITPSNAWRTIMAYVNGCGSCPRLGYFSNPNVLYQGLPMGTAATHDNARVHRERVATVAAFFSPPAVAPVNDNFASATALPGTTTGSATGTNVAASKETSEPLHAGNAGGASVWWTFVAPSTGAYTIDTVGSGFNTLLGVYTGNAVNALTPIASNDDIGGGVTQSSVTFQAIGGTTYRIAVDGFNSGAGPATGAITLNWRRSRKERDFNADGKADILWRDTGSGNTVVSLMSGATISSSTFVATLPLTWSVVGLGDVGPDGKTDIFWRDSTNGNLVASQMNGAAITSSTFVAQLPLTWTVAGIGDFNGDGKADILWRDTSNGNLVVSLMNGATIVSSTFVANLPLTWSVVGIGDFNGDGKADILWRDTSTGNAVVSLMNGASIASSTFVATLPLTWSVAGIGDFDNDGKADILWRDSNNGNVVVSLMNGATIVSSTFVATLPLSWQIAALGDFTGNGRSGILWRDSSNGNVVVSLMSGANIVSSTFVANLPLSWAIQGFNVN